MSKKLKVKEKKFISNITDALVKARKDAGVSQKQMAELLKVAQPSISVGERGDGWPNTRKIYEYANALNLDVEITFKPKKNKK